MDDNARPRKRAARASEVRSRRGCLTCRRRRKKCPEDVQERADGSLSCSACYARAEVCDLDRQSEVPHSRHSRSSSNLIHRQGPSVVPQTVYPALPLAAPPFNTTSAAGPGISTSHNYPSTLPANSLEPGPIDPFLLDDFFRDFVDLSENFLSGPTPSESVIGSATGPTTESAASPSTHAVPTGPKHDHKYDRIIGSDDISKLLEKYKFMYEGLWSTLFTIRRKEDKLRHTSKVMEIVKSSQACRASSLVVCLAYHELMRRLHAENVVPSTFSSHFPARFQSPSDLSLSRNDSGDERIGPQYHPARPWLAYAMDAYRKTKTYRLATLEQRILCLLNLRWATTCVLGATDARELIPDFREEMRNLDLDASYLLRTEARGSVLSGLLQNIMISEIFEAAAVRGRRSALNGGIDVVLKPATALSSLPRKEWEGDESEEFDFNFVSRLSGMLVICFKSISDLAADIAEGIITSPTQIEASRQRLMTAISHCSLPHTSLIGLASVRANNLHEQWRQATIINLHQMLGYGPLCEPIRQALHDIIAMSKMLHEEESLRRDLSAWDMCTVWFLACTVSITDEERRYCLDKLSNLKQEQSVLDNVEIIHLLWRLTDERGHTIDWHALVKEHKLAVNYTF